MTSEKNANLENFSLFMIKITVINGINVKKALSL